VVLYWINLCKKTIFSREAMMIQRLNGETFMVKVLYWPTYNAIFEAELHQTSVTLQVAAYCDGRESAAPLQLSNVRNLTTNQDGTFMFCGDYTQLVPTETDFGVWCFISESGPCRVDVDKGNKMARLQFNIKLTVWE
jgi:hypothetical protein